MPKLALLVTALLVSVAVSAAIEGHPANVKGAWLAMLWTGWRVCSTPRG